LHFQRAPYTKVKVASCAKGVLFDVIIDLRGSSPTDGKWQGFELSAANGHQALYPGYLNEPAENLECVADAIARDAAANRQKLHRQLIDRLPGETDRPAMVVA
jgi:dTDP-4-dehydrorhamnose 3,5-epimerase